MPRILIVDDEPRITQMIARGLCPLGCEIDTAGDGRAAIDKINRHDYDVVITDVVMAGPDGFAVLAAARQLARPPEVIIITGFGTIHSAVEAMKLGAAEYITKPLDIPKLCATVKSFLERPDRPNDPCPSEDGDFSGMVGRAEPMQQLYHLIEHVAPTSSTVMIYGESGTGKEFVARAIHVRSSRRDGPFVAVDCGSLAETLLESELFGHVKGAFTGAVEDKTGLFEAADGGTIFLDEIAEMTPGLQQKLLRTIQERAVRPIGSTALRKVDVRIVSATNHVLERLVDEKKFRQDLYYRLNVVLIPVPRLVERREDIPALAEHFARKHTKRFRRRPPAISDTVMAMLKNANWPGNVRQLENVIECAVTFAEGDEIRPEHLAANFIESFDLARSASRADETMRTAAQAIAPADITPLGAAIRYLERQMLSKALDAANGNKEQAAGLLGIDRATLYRKLKAHKLPSDK